MIGTIVNRCTLLAITSKVSIASTSIGTGGVGTIRVSITLGWHYHALINICANQILACQPITRIASETGATDSTDRGDTPSVGIARPDCRVHSCTIIDGGASFSITSEVCVTSARETAWCIGTISVRRTTAIICCTLVNISASLSISCRRGISSRTFTRDTREGWGTGC
jgi:hypothetical protein